MRARLLLVALLLSPAPAAADPGDARALRWPAGVDAALSVTADDGVYRHWVTLAPMLSERGLAGTFYVVTGWATDDSLWDTWSDVAAQGHEVGSHSVSHRDLVTLDATELAAELQDSRATLQAEVGTEHGTTHAFPYSSADGTVVAAAEAAGYLAARTGGNRLVEDDDPLFALPSVHPVTGWTADDVLPYLDQAIGGERWMILGIHGVRVAGDELPETHEGWEPVEQEVYAAVFDRAAAEVAAGRLWVAPVRDVARRVRSWRLAEATPLGVDDAVIGVGLEGDGAVLDWEIEVPTDWVRVDVRVDEGARIRRDTVERAGRRYVVVAAAAPAVVDVTPATLPGEGEPPPLVGEPVPVTGCASLGAVALLPLLLLGVRRRP